jgi:hypothetical protein
MVFARALEQGFVTGRMIENPHAISLNEFKECAVPTAFVQIDKFVKFADGRPVFDFAEFGLATACAVRMADNLVDIFSPIIKGISEERRIAIGAVGLSKALADLGLDASNAEAWEMSSRIQRQLKLCAYRTSISLAAEKATYPAFHAKAMLERPEIRLLPVEMRDDIAYFGMRNTVLFCHPLTADE